MMNDTNYIVGFVLFCLSYGGIIRLRDNVIARVLASSYLYIDNVHFSSDNSTLVFL